MRKKQCCQNSENIYVSTKKPSLISKKTPCPHFHENYKPEPTVLRLYSQRVHTQYLICRTLSYIPSYTFFCHIFCRLYVVSSTISTRKVDSFSVGPCKISWLIKTTKDRHCCIWAWTQVIMKRAACSSRKGSTSMCAGVDSWPRYIWPLPQGTSISFSCW